jgi:Uma2 family endonuclease
MAVAPRPLALEQFLELPEKKPALEYADGLVTQKVSPKGKHSRLQVELTECLDQAGRRNRLALAFTELRTTFAGVSRVPDIAVYRWERIPVDDSGEVAHDFREPPEIGVEIASPEQSGNAPVRRCLWYVSHGVNLSLLVDPSDRSVIAFRPDRVPEVWRGSDRIDVDELLPDLELTVEELFASLHMR